MGESLMPKVAELLGVGLKEIFKVANAEGKIYNIDYMIDTNALWERKTMKFETCSQIKAFLYAIIKNQFGHYYEHLGVKDKYKENIITENKLSDEIEDSGLNISNNIITYPIKTPVFCEGIKFVMGKTYEGSTGGDDVLRIKKIDFFGILPFKSNISCGKKLSKRNNSMVFVFLYFFK